MDATTTRTITGRMCSNETDHRRKEGRGHLHETGGTDKGMSRLTVLEGIAKNVHEPDRRTIWKRHPLQEVAGATETRRHLRVLRHHGRPQQDGVANLHEQDNDGGGTQAFGDQEEADTEWA